jgi:three-Cys-motif partner protein
MGNKFGGPWTEKKIEIIIKYSKAYLQIMKTRNFSLIYFDGFAGSGKIEENPNYGSLIEGVASNILSIDNPRSFDLYYLVELDNKKAKELEKFLNNKFPNKKNITHVVVSDCNQKLRNLSSYLRKDPARRALAFIDPQGMEVEWESILNFKDLGIDMWILIPTGIGVNRLLIKSGNIPKSWLTKLKKFLGLTEEEIISAFYIENPQGNLFNTETQLEKEKKVIDKIIKLYCDKLKAVWKYASNPYPMKNTKGSLMYHFLMLTNNSTAVKIANDIIKNEIKLG